MVGGLLAGKNGIVIVTIVRKLGCFSTRFAFFFATNLQGLFLAITQLPISYFPWKLTARKKNILSFWWPPLRDIAFVNFRGCVSTMLSLPPEDPYIWSNYSDLTRPHSKWWFSKGNPLNSGKARLVKYYNLIIYIYIVYVPTFIVDVYGTIHGSYMGLLYYSLPFVRKVPASAPSGKLKISLWSHGVVRDDKLINSLTSYLATRMSQEISKFSKWLGSMGYFTYCTYKWNILGL